LIELRPCADEPELLDPAIVGQFAEAMAQVVAVEQVPPWCAHVGRRAGQPAGFGGFKDPPDADGTVEIGYLTFPAHEGAGVATEVATGLVAIARAHGARWVIAHTLCEPNASTKVLEKAGFARDGFGHDDDEGEVWRWKRKVD
jgi:RimJ/RimL family protein N-acetyltransferase